MVQTPGDLVGLQSLEIEAQGLNAMGLARSDVLLLAAGGNGDVAAAESLDIANDGTDPAVEKAKREILVAEQPALFACLRGYAEDAGTAQALDAVGQADLKILLAGIEREQDGDLLAFLQGFAGWLLSSDDQQFHLAEAELRRGVLGADGIHLLDSGQDRQGDEGGTVCTLFDPAAEHAVEGLGIQPSLTQLFLDEFGPYHERHLRSGIPTCTVRVFAPDARWHNTSFPFRRCSHPYRTALHLQNDRLHVVEELLLEDPIQVIYPHRVMRDVLEELPFVLPEPEHDPAVGSPREVPLEVERVGVALLRVQLGDRPGQVLVALDLGVEDLQGRQHVRLGPVRPSCSFPQ